MKKTGDRCNAIATTGSKFCFFHDPNKKKAANDARRSGGERGKAATLPPDTPDIEINSPEAIVGLLSDTVNQVRKGLIDSRIANAIGYLSGMILKAREQGELEDRLKAIEDHLNREKGKL